LFIFYKLDKGDIVVADTELQISPFHH